MTPEAVAQDEVALRSATIGTPGITNIAGWGSARQSVMAGPE
jgi:hypothetical protein